MLSAVLHFVQHQAVLTCSRPCNWCCTQKWASLGTWQPPSCHAACDLGSSRSSFHNVHCSIAVLSRMFYIDPSSAPHQRHTAACVLSALRDVAAGWQQAQSPGADEDLVVAVVDISGRIQEIDTSVVGTGGMGAHRLVRLGIGDGAALPDGLIPNQLLRLRHLSTGSTALVGAEQC